MKKILTGVIGCVFLFIIFSFLFPMSTVKSTVNLYWILNHRPFVTYVDCEQLRRTPFMPTLAGTWMKERTTIYR